MGCPTLETEPCYYDNFLKAMNLKCDDPNHSADAESLLLSLH